jgi:UDP-glucose:glycoprotein glucosyltransferase
LGLDDVVTRSDLEVVVYLSVERSEWVEYTQRLRKMKIPFVVRFMGYQPQQQDACLAGDGENQVCLATNTPESAFLPTALQGYGVRLDIKNSEYKSFDDKVDGSDEASMEERIQTQTNILSDMTTFTIYDWKHFLKNGIPFNLDMNDNPQFINFISHHLSHLKSEDAMYSYHTPPPPPPTEERRELSLQASKVIAQSQDPLWTLLHISQNLPSHLSSLANVTIPSSLISQVEEKMQQHAPMDQFGPSSSNKKGVFELHVNGRRMPIERPSFNLFELIQVIRQEESFLESIVEKLGPYLDYSMEGMEAVSSLLSMGKENLEELGKKMIATDDKSSSKAGDGGMKEMMTMMGISDSMPKFRIDVGRGYRGAVHYINDIEKDREYEGWPRDVQQMMMSMQFGGPPTVRRNVLTLLLVADPFMDFEGLDTDLSLEQYLESLGLLIQLMQNQYPIRFGFIFASEDDMKTCRELHSKGDDEDCQHVTSTRKSINDENTFMEKIAKTESTFLMLQYVSSSYGSMAALPYFYMLLDSIQKKKRVSLTNTDLIDIHLQIFQNMGIPTNGAKESIVQVITDDKTEFGESYAKSVKFAVVKNIQPGSAFVNGIPLPLTSPQEIHTIIGTETQTIMAMVATQQITNTAPRSIYAKLLSGENIYSTMHPLLSESIPNYRLISSKDFTESLITTQERSVDLSLGHVLFDVVADFDSDKGLRLIESFLSSMIEYSKLDVKSPVSFQVLPKNLDSAKSMLGAILRHSNMFVVEDLCAIVRTVLRTKEYDRKSLVLNEFADLGGKVLDDLEKSLDMDKCHHYSEADIDCPVAFSEDVDLILANGRVFIPDDTVNLDEIKLLIELEQGLSMAIANRFPSKLPTKTHVPQIMHARIAAFLGEIFSSEQFVSSGLRSDTFHKQSEVSDPLFFSWNNGVEKDSTKLMIKISAVLDPLSEAVQRAAPILYSIRDHLKIPVSLSLLPRLVIQDDSALPMASYYRFVAEPTLSEPKASFEGMPAHNILTMKMDVPEPWDVQQSYAVQDTDNLRCDRKSCTDTEYATVLGKEEMLQYASLEKTIVQYDLNHLLFSGQCYDVTSKTPPNGLQFTLEEDFSETRGRKVFSDTLVMKTVGYWQLRANPGAWQLKIAENSRGSQIYEMIDGSLSKGRIQVTPDAPVRKSQTLAMKDFVTPMDIIFVRRKDGQENAELLVANQEYLTNEDDNTVHVFSLATGHLYERLLKIMMLSVTKRTSTKVKFWLFENFLSPSFKSSAFALAKEIGCELEFVTYKWPEWLRGQSEKQRIIWGYKILFLDVLFPLDLNKIIYVDADQVMRGDLKELWDLDLEGAPYGYTPMCETNPETTGYQFWNTGFWEQHLKGKPYHISALYVVDLQRFRRELVGDMLRGTYQQLSADPNSLANLDQDLPNYTQHQAKIFSLPQDWLWCESWCSNETKVTAKTIDLCNNPLHKEPKVSMAKRIISGELFEESWTELDEEVESYESV